MAIEEFYGSDKLFTLKDASDRERMSPILWEVMQPRLQPDASFVDVEVETLRRRKQRCVLRYRLHYQQDGKSHTVPLIGKIYKANRGEPVKDLMQELWQLGFDREAADGISIPEVTAYLPRLSLLIQEEIGGVPIKEYLKTPDAETAMRRMGAGLAKLHRTPLRIGPTFTMEDHLRRCHPRPAVLRERCPDLRPAVDEIISEANRLERAYSDVEPVLIHGDFHMGQVHTSLDHTWLIDFDACCVADPAADVGNILVFLRGKKNRVEKVEGLIDAFLDEYFKTMPDDTMKRVPLFVAVTLLRRACKRLRFGEDGWHRKVRRFLEASLESLAEARG